MPGAMPQAKAQVAPLALNAYEACATVFESCFEKDRRCRALRPRAAKKRRQKMLSHQTQSRQTARLTLEKSAGAPIDRATSNSRPSKPQPTARPPGKFFRD